jgi:hypothetical protein
VLSVPATASVAASAEKRKSFTEDSPSAALGSSDGARPALVRQSSSTAVIDADQLPPPTNAAEAASFNVARVSLNKARVVRADTFAVALKSLLSVQVPAKDASKAALRAFVQRSEIAAVLSTLSDAVGHSGVLTCAALMHEHAVWTGTTLNATDVSRVSDVLRCFIAHASAADVAERKPIAAAFLSYLSSHTVDPENCLVGLRANDKALKELLSPEAMAELMVKRELESELSRQRLLEVIGGWNAMSRPQIHSMAVALARRVSSMWQAGDMLVVFLRRGVYVFARFSGKRTGTKLLVYMSAAEVDAVAVEVQQCFVLSRSIIEQIASGRSALSLTTTPINDFVVGLGDQSIVDLGRFLEKEFNVDLELLQRAADTDKLDMGDHFALLYARHALSTVAGTAKFKTWLNDYRALLIGSAIDFCKSVDPSEVPAPSRVRQFRDFAFFPTQQVQVIESQLRRHESTLANALQSLARRRDMLLRGEVKAQLTSWWLDVIRARVDAFLAGIGFKDHLGSNFLDRDKPPADMPAVIASSRLLDECLAEEDKHGFKAVQKELADKIYPAVRHFLAEACCTIAFFSRMQLAWPQTMPGIDAAVEAGKAFKGAPAIQSGLLAVAAGTDSASAAIVLQDQILDLTRDIEYLVRMQQLEVGGASRDVTPISGLALSRIVRTWRDHRTVIEMHGGALMTPPPALAGDAVIGAAAAAAAASDDKVLKTSSGRSKSGLIGSMMNLKQRLFSSSDDLRAAEFVDEPYRAKIESASMRSDDGAFLPAQPYAASLTDSLSAELSTASESVQSQLSRRGRSESGRFDQFFGGSDTASLWESAFDEPEASAETHK